MSVTVEDFTTEWNRELDRRNRFSHILRGIARENTQSLNAAELNKMEIDEKIRQAIYVWAHRNQRGRYLHSHKGKALRQHKLASKGRLNLKVRESLHGSRTHMQFKTMLSGTGVHMHQNHFKGPEEFN